MEYSVSPLTIRIPGFEYKGVHFGNLEVDDMIEHSGCTPVDALRGGVMTLAEMSALYEIALAGHVERGPVFNSSMETALKADTLHSNILSQDSLGEWTDDACDYGSDRRPQGIIVPADFVPVRWVKHPLFVKNGDGWEARMQEGSEECHIFLPPSGYVIPTCDGLYRPDTGTPFATMNDRNKAMDLLPHTFVLIREYPSYFRRARKPQQGKTCAVSHRNRGSRYGHYAIDVRAAPDSRDDHLGFRQMRRLKQ